MPPIRAMRTRVDGRSARAHAFGPALHPMRRPQRPPTPHRRLLEDLPTLRSPEIERCPHDPRPFRPAPPPPALPRLHRPPYSGRPGVERLLQPSLRHSHTADTRRRLQNARLRRLGQPLLLPRRPHVLPRWAVPRQPSRRPRSRSHGWLRRPHPPPPLQSTAPDQHDRSALGPVRSRSRCRGACHATPLRELPSLGHSPAALLREVEFPATTFRGQTEGLGRSGYPASRGSAAAGATSLGRWRLMRSQTAFGAMPPRWQRPAAAAVQVGTPGMGRPPWNGPADSAHAMAAVDQTDHRQCSYVSVLWSTDPLPLPLPSPTPVDPQ